MNARKVCKAGRPFQSQIGDLSSARSRAYVWEFMEQWAKGTLVATSTTFVLANEKVGRRSGQIRLHGPEDFAAMRKAGALTAEALDLIGPAR